MLSKFAKPAHGEEKKSENSEDGGNNSKACEHTKLILNTRQHDPHGLVEECQKPRKERLNEAADL